MRYREKPGTGGIYHVYNRGVEKRNIFISDSDRMRLIHTLQIFNASDRNFNVGRKINTGTSALIGVGLQSEKLVNILAFVFMPNHYHLMLEQVAENGITEFMRKVGTGYTNYFNLKYQRVGPLFQGKYKFIRLSENRHLLHLPHYIHLNPLDLYEPNWRKGPIANTESAVKFLKSYKWSSYHNYIGNPSFPGLINRTAAKDFFEDYENYENNLMEWLREDNKPDLPKIALESIDLE